MRAHAIALALGIASLPPLAAPPSPARAGRVAELPYGASPGAVGRGGAAGSERQGPRSFAVDGRGRVYVCDTVNSRITVLSPSGGVEAQYPVRGFAGDVAADGEGGVVVLDEEAAVLRRYDASGAPRGAVPVPRAVFRERDLLEARGGRVRVRSRDGGEFDAAVLARDGLRRTEGDAVGRRGAEGADGLRYEVRRESGRAVVTVRDEAGRTVGGFGTAVPRLASVTFLGSDPAGRICLQIEQAGEDGTGVRLGVLRVGRDGKVLGRIDDIPNDYACWTVRLLAADGNGDIYQVLPAPDCVRVNRWRWGAPGSEGGAP